MKAIHPLQWKKNAPEATHLSVNITFDDLETVCRIYWALRSSNGGLVESGHSEINGAAYSAWNGANDYVWQFVATELGISLSSENV